MSVARHPRPPELEGVPVEDIMQRYVGRFREKKPDWAAFEDAKIEGYKRAQHRFIGAGGSGKHGAGGFIPAGNFTLSIMYVEPGQGNAAHTHEVEEVFFVLQGFLDVFVEDEAGKRITTRLGPWECISAPAIPLRRPPSSITSMRTAASNGSIARCSSAAESLTPWDTRTIACSSGVQPISPPVSPVLN